jgi:hypothetical protein
VRGTCNILVKRNGALEECAKLSVYSQPCQCDTCDVDQGYHEPSYWCAEHYDKLMNPSRSCWNCGSDDHWPIECPEPDSFVEPWEGD